MLSFCYDCQKIIFLFQRLKSGAPTSGSGDGHTMARPNWHGCQFAPERSPSVDSDRGVKLSNQRPGDGEGGSHVSLEPGHRLAHLALQ